MAKDITFRDLSSFDAAVLMDIHDLIADNVQAAIFFSQAAEEYEEGAAERKVSDLEKYKLDDPQAALQHSLDAEWISATPTTTTDEGGNGNA